jgi:hypothetical protein
MGYCLVEPRQRVVENDVEDTNGREAHFPLGHSCAQYAIGPNILQWSGPRTKKIKSPLRGLKLEF